MRLWGLLFVLVTVCPLLAQPPVLEKWRTTNGAEAEGVFFAFDEDAGVVTLLIPRRVSIDRLDADARARVQEIVASPESPVEASQDQRATPLFNPTVAQWLDADATVRSATCVHFLYVLLSERMASEQLRKATRTLSDLERAGNVLANAAHFFLTDEEIVKASGGKLTSNEFRNGPVYGVFIELAAGQEWTLKPEVGDVQPTTTDARLPNFASFAYQRSGEGSIDTNSLPFSISPHCLYMVGIEPVEYAPFVSVQLDGLEDSKVIGDHVSTQGSGRDGTHCIAKLSYGRGGGLCYASIRAQNARWFVAIVNLERIPTEHEVTEICRVALEEAGWPVTTPITQ